MRIVIPDQLCDLNEYVKKERGNKFSGSAIKKEETRRCFIYGRQYGHFDIPQGHKVSINFHWYREDRRTDPDNIAFAKKFILDGLVEAKVLANDSWKMIHKFQDLFYLDKEHPRTEIELELVKIQ